MGKKFAPRVSKKDRKTIDLSDKLNRDLIALSDKILFKDAALEELPLCDIVVKDQVRTKFNDSSLKELSENIKQNGLIQPLVVHRIDGRLTLVCGERRYRAMKLIKKKTAPCFILDNKSSEELMAIQFSENSAREELHYIDKADGILNYQKATKASERSIVKALGISKSEVHRSLLIARLPKRVKEAAKKHNTEKYVLIEFDVIEDPKLKKSIERKILSGDIDKRSQLKNALNGVDGKIIKKKQAGTLKRGTSASAFIKAMKSQSKDLDPEMAKALEKLVEETKDVMSN